MKIFALYLPQFHEIPENNMWWGEGFTEWSNVKKARPLFKNHCQPQLPLNNNFYNLLDKKTVKEQTELMTDYGVDGFIYYHYYFRGKLLLEQPAENLLKWTDIQQPFYFCWANHSWYKATNNKKELLIEIEYGKKEDWEKHFNYLLPFFKDDRYEKRNNRPVFMLFNNKFDEKNAMADYFDERCKDNGFDGICLIETVGEVPKISMTESFCKQTDYVFLREPNTSSYIYRHNLKYAFSNFRRKIQKVLIKLGVKGIIEKYDGNKLFDIMIKEEPKNNSGILHGVFFEWDNTPRHSYRGFIITPPKKNKFIEYMNTIKNDDYIIVNAWNEWAEGMMLEPTKKNGYTYLEWIREWKSMIINKG